MKKAILIGVIAFFMISLASAANVGASLTVPPLNNSTLTISYSPSSPQIGAYVTFKADYENENGTDIQNAMVTIDIGGQVYNMTYNPSLSAYAFKKQFNSEGTYFFTINATKIGYHSKSESSSFSVTKKDDVPYSDSPSYIYINYGNQSERLHAVPPYGIINISLPGNFQRLIITNKLQITYGNVNINLCKNDTVDIPKKSIFYDCISINLYKIKNTQIENSTIYFKVSKEWIDVNKINESSIRLLEISKNSTKTITLTPLNEDSKFRYYYANVNFSDFIIYGDKLPENETTNITVTSQSHAQCYSIFSLCWYWWILIGTVIVGSYIVYFKTEETSEEEKKKAQSKINRLNTKLEILHKEAKKLEKNIKKTKNHKGKSFGTKIKKLKELHEKIRDTRDEIVELEHKYNIKPKTTKRK